MENNIKEIAKRNFLTLEANHKYVKRLANISYNDENYTYHKRAESQKLLTGYIWHTWRTEQYTNKDILGFDYPNHDGTVIVNDGYIPSDYTMWLLNVAYYIIKHGLLKSEKSEQLINYINSTYSHCMKHIGNPEYEINTLDNEKHLKTIIEFLSKEQTIKNIKED